MARGFGSLPSSRASAARIRTSVRSLGVLPTSPTCVPVSLNIRKICSSVYRLSTTRSASSEFLSGAFQPAQESLLIVLVWMNSFSGRRRLPGTGGEVPGALVGSGTPDQGHTGRQRVRRAHSCFSAVMGAILLALTEGIEAAPTTTKRRSPVAPRYEAGSVGSMP